MDGELWQISVACCWRNWYVNKSVQMGDNGTGNILLSFLDSFLVLTGMKRLDGWKEDEIHIDLVFTFLNKTFIVFLNRKKGPSDPIFVKPFRSTPTLLLVLHGSWIMEMMIIIVFKSHEPLRLSLEWPESGLGRFDSENWFSLWRSKKSTIKFLPTSNLFFMQHESCFILIVLLPGFQLLWSTKSRLSIKKLRLSRLFL